VLEKWAPQDAFVFILRGAFTGMMLSWIVSLGAHVVFRRRASPQALAHIPLRSPLGAWGSAIGFALVCGAVLKTWWDSRVNLVSGLLGILVLSGLYFVIRLGRAGPVHPDIAP
jgi:L-asparagine transporter-like permease